MTTKDSIENFLSSKNYAVVGVSRKKSKFGTVIYKELKKSVNLIITKTFGGRSYEDFAKFYFIDHESFRCCKHHKGHQFKKYLQ